MDMRARAPSSVYVRAERSEWAKERGEGTTVTWQASGRLFAGRLFAGRLVAGGGSGQGTGDDRRTSARGGKRSALVSHTLLGASARTSAPQLGRRASLANVYTCGQECSAGPHGPVTAASAAQANRGGLALARRVPVRGTHSMAGDLCHIRGQAVTPTVERRRPELIVYRAASARDGRCEPMNQRSRDSWVVL